MHRSAMVFVLLLFMSGSSSSGQVRSGAPSCDFEVVENLEQPTLAVAGPEEVVSRLHVVHQPDSPVEMVGLDLEGTQFVASESNGRTRFTYQLNGNVDFRNRSDQVVERVDVAIRVGSCQPPAGRPGDSWFGRLRPGGTTTLPATESGGSGGAAEGVGQVFFWAWIDRVEFGQCAYRPSQVIARELCSDPRDPRFQ